MLSYWSAPQWAMPPVTVKEGPLGKWLNKGAVVVISWKVREEADSGILFEGLEITSLGPLGELEVPGNRLGTTSYSGPEPSLRPSSSLDPGLEEWWTSLHPCLCNLLIVVVFLDLSLWELVSSLGQPEGTGPIGFGAWLFQGWEMGRMWEPRPEGDPTDICFYLTRMGHFKVKVVPWDFALSCQDRK